mgnify:CR=1 FL=1
MNDEKEYMIDLIRKVSNKSMNGEIDWTQPNPSTFQWIHDTQNNPLIVSIQRAITTNAAARLMGLANMESIADYLFQIQESSPKRVVVSLSSKERPQLTNALEELYASAERGIDRRTNRAIERLLSP